MRMKLLTPKPLMTYKRANFRISDTEMKETLS